MIRVEVNEAANKRKGERNQNPGLVFFFFFLKRPMKCRNEKGCDYKY